jgi:hypothetical protein
MHGRHTERESLALHPSQRQQMMERAPRLQLHVNSQVVLEGPANGIGKVSGRRGSRKVSKPVCHSTPCLVAPAPMTI